MKERKKEKKERWRQRDTRGQKSGIMNQKKEEGLGGGQLGNKRKRGVKYYFNKKYV